MKQFLDLSVRVEDQRLRSRCYKEHLLVEIDDKESRNAHKIIRKHLDALRRELAERFDEKNYGRNAF